MAVNVTGRKIRERKKQQMFRANSPVLQSKTANEASRGEFAAKIASDFSGRIAQPVRAHA